MNVFHWIWILLLGCGVEASAGTKQPPLVLSAAVGADVRFPVQIPDGFEFGDITWLFKGRNLVQFIPPNKTVEKEKAFKGRVSVNGQNASLHIWNLTMEDGGEYSVEVYKKIETTDKEVREYTLRIFNIVTAQVNISTGNETCNIILKCTEKDGINVNYEWREGHVKTSKEPIVNFTLREGEDKLEICCQVKNSVSTSEKCVIPWKEAIEGFNHSNCKLPRGFDGTSVYRHAGVAVGIVVVCLFGLAAVAALIWCRKRLKVLKDKKDVQTVYATVNKPKNATQEEDRYLCTEEPYEMKRVQTLYAEVQNTQKVEAPPTSAINRSTSKEDTGNTVYDKVQRPKNMMDEKKKHLNGNPAPPYDEIIGETTDLLNRSDT